MKKIIEPGSGVDDMGGGIAMGCGKWVIIFTVAIFLILFGLRALKVI